MNRTHQLPSSQHPKLPIPFELLFFIGVIAISFSAIFVRWSDAPVSVIAMYRLYLTNALMLPLLWLYRKQLLTLTPKQWLLLACSGVMLGLHFLLWMASLRYTTVASSTVILTLEPVLVMLGAFLLFRTRPNRAMIIGMLIALAGSVMIGWSDLAISGDALFGDVLSFLGAAAVAVHMLLGKQLREHIGAFVYSFWVFGFAATSLAMYNAVQGHAFTGYPSEEWGLFLLLAIVPTLFGHYLFNWLLKYVQAAAVSMTVLGEPIGAALLAYVLLDERISLIQGVAGLFVLAGIWIFIRRNEQ